MRFVRMPYNSTSKSPKKGSITRPPDEPLSSQGPRRRCDPYGAMRTKLQHPLVAEDDPQKRHPPLFVSDKRVGFDWIIGKNFGHESHRTLQTRSANRVVGMKMNFSWTTFKLAHCYFLLLSCSSHVPSEGTASQ